RQGTEPLGHFSPLHGGSMGADLSAFPHPSLPSPPNRRSQRVSLMPPTRPKLTPAIQQAIIAYVRAGGFPHVAAEAAGVSAETFDHWMELGERPRAAAKYRDFADAVRQPVAQARLGAE